MPELPEVETIRRQLAPLVKGRSLERVEILDPRWSRPLAPRELADALVGRTVGELVRRGKYLVWSFCEDVHLAQHLRMTGCVLCEPDPEPAHTRVRIELGPAPPPPSEPISAHSAHTRVRIELGPAGHKRARGPALAGSHRGAPQVRRCSLRLAIVDRRRLGTGELLLGREALERFFDARLGLEPLDERFTAQHLHALARGRSAPIKAFLLDQRRIAGVGNIYADEALFLAGIHPLLPAGRLSGKQHARLREALVTTLNAGIEARGATIDDFRHVDGVWGSFQERFQVHRRAGEPCPRCGREIVKLFAAGRGSYVCERCQPRPRQLDLRASPRACRSGMR